MSVYVFLGPTLPVNEAEKIVRANYLPPVAMGDVLRLLSLKPKVIAIIDGLFETVPSVWHKEILFALSQGVHVVGASSMGALRAVELHSFGMKGIGKIFEAYRDAVLEMDDEVAVAHGDAEVGFRQLSDPLVNIREGLQRAAREDVISITTAERLLTLQKKRFYPERSWVSLLSDAEKAGVPESEVKALRDRFPSAPNLKREDAVALLEYVRDEFRGDIAPHVPNFDFEATYYWNGLVALEGMVSGTQRGEWVSNSALGRHLRLISPLRRELFNKALFSFLLYHEAKRCGMLPPSDGGSADRFLSGASRLLPLGVENFTGLTAELADEFTRVAGGQLDFFMAVELARTGELEEALRDVRRKSEVLTKRGIKQPKLSDAGIDLQGLSDWYEGRFGKLETSADAHAQELGFASWEDFISEVIAEYLVSQSAP